MTLKPIIIGQGFSIKKALQDGYNLRTSAYGGMDFYKQIETLTEGGKLEDDSFFTKALDSSTSASGVELIPSIYNAQIIKYLYENNWARQYFGTWVMRSITEYVPKINSDIQIDYHSAAFTGDASTDYLRESTPSTTSITLTLKTLAVRMILDNKFLSYNVNKQIENVLRDQIASKMASVEEDVILNGDTTTGASNLNNAYDVTNHPHGYDTTHNEWLIIMNGLRHDAAGTAVDCGGDAFSVPDIMSGLKNLGIYGRNRAKVALIVSPDIALTMLQWDQIETFETYGAGATVYHGEIGRIKPYGLTIIESDKMPCTSSSTLTDSTGARSSTTANNLYSEALLVYQEAVLIGVPAYPERLLKIQTLDKPDQDRKELIGVEDIALGKAYTAGLVRLYDILP